MEARRMGERERQRRSVERGRERGGKGKGRMGRSQEICTGKWLPGRFYLVHYTANFLLVR
jgi:hypothetical protein